MSTPSTRPADPTGSTSTSAPEPEPAVLVAEIQRLAWQLARRAPAQSGGLPLSPAECRQVEELTGLGSTRSALSLIAAIDRLAAIRIGDVRLPFTPGQLSELQHRAVKRGHTVEQEIRAAVARIEDELFHRGG
jgi:hypothetical protein